MFDLTVDSIDVTLSLWRWLEADPGRCNQGRVGRSVYWDPDNPLDPASFRHIACPCDFELESLQLEDVLVTVYQPGGFRPCTALIWISRHSASSRSSTAFCVRRTSLHKSQSIGRTTEMDLKDGDWGRMICASFSYVRERSGIRIDGVPIEPIQRGTTGDGPISWITSGKVDDIKFPRDLTDASSFSARSRTRSSTRSWSASPAQRGLAKPPLQAPPAEKMENAPDVPPR
ncbi:hypothetical protein B0H12DRAFT_1072787 [Mycena haematopus]|nr:hypothetical protein B0H12DRAFT_1072787 [Mycena haematopus]